jgi:phosphinothricin acetyltransferase
MEAPDAKEIAARIAYTSQSYPWIVADDNGRIAGYVYASQHLPRAAYQWSANVTAYLHPDYQRRGLGKQLYRLLFGMLRRQGYRSLYGGITLPNAASEALHRSTGMETVGIYRNVGFKLGAWRDVIWLGMSFDDERPPSGPPTKYESLPGNEIDVELRI